MALRNEGTISFWLNHKNSLWADDAGLYEFEPFSDSSVSIKATKHPDRTIEIVIALAGGEEMRFRHPLPAPLPLQGLHVAASWRSGSLKLYLAGKPVETVSFPAAVIH